MAALSVRARRGFKARFASDLVDVLLSRPLIAAIVRRCVTAAPNMHIVEACRVRGLVPCANLRRIAGVRFAPHSMGEREMGADLVGGFLGDHAPADENGFLTFARSLPTPDVHDVVSTAEAL